MGPKAHSRIDAQGWVAAAAIVAVLVAGCDWPPRGDTWTLRDDCQQDSLLIRLPADTAHLVDTLVTADDLPLIQRIANFPEFHDCQRFVVATRAASATNAAEYAFGPLVAIWAADSLQTRFAGTSLHDVKATPVALMYDFERGVGYESLGIQPGFNCLYMWNDGRWQAGVVPLGDSTKPCLERVDTLSREIIRGKRLQVIPAALPPTLDSMDVAPVARWDWDAKHMWQYVGIRCGNEWCEVGPDNFVPSAGSLDGGLTPAAFRAIVEPIKGITDESGTPEELLRVVAVKGWYDQQQLDTLSTTGMPMLTDVVGTVIPHPALERAPFTPGDWTPVAYVSVTAPYSGKVPLHRGISRIYLCRGSREVCQANPQGTAACPVEVDDPAHPSTEPLTTWWTRIVPAGGVASDYCIMRRRHGGKAIPAAAARWNWNELDAKTWISCGGACCTVN